MAAQVDVDAHQVDVLRCQGLSAHGDDVLGGDAVFVHLKSDVDGHELVREARRLPEVREVGPEPQADARLPARIAGRVLDELELVDIVHSDPDPGSDAVRQVLPALAPAVDRDEPGVDPGLKRGMELSGRIHITPRTLLRKDPAQRQEPVGLDGGQDVHLPFPPSI